MREQLTIPTKQALAIFAQVAAITVGSFAALAILTCTGVIR